MVVRTDGPSATTVGALRSALRAMDSTIPIGDVHTIEDLRWAAVAGARFQGLLLGGFAAVALLLAVVGIAGVMAYSVSRRTREIGIRLAVGASSAEIRGLVLREGVGLTLAGATLGLVAALPASMGIAALLFEVDPLDPLVFFVVPAVLIVTSLVACAVPARRASSV